MGKTGKSRTSKQSHEISEIKDAELLVITLKLRSEQESSLYPQYTIGLHAWFLDQVRQYDPNLSAYLHDGESEKPFTISKLEGPLLSKGKTLQLQAGEIYEWRIAALSRPVVQWLTSWLSALPQEVDLRGAPLTIQGWKISEPPTTYEQIWERAGESQQLALSLSFISPTSFRRKGHHFPLPLPTNVFHSYLRRWNDFSARKFIQEEFIDWVDESVIIARHFLASVKTVAGKKGSVTGFTGSVEFGVSSRSPTKPEFIQLYKALWQLAPYCGTGHKTTFGLGQTRLGWLEAELVANPPSILDSLAHRIAELTELFVQQRQRQGGERARQIAEKWATILARREFGESLQAIASDLEMPYETVKTYAKLARKTLGISRSR
jgi:CRISPR-associated endoribonuclease Cas6